MEYITVNRVNCSRKPADEEQARQDLFDFIVNEIFDGNKKTNSDVKISVRRLHSDEVTSYLASLKANCAAAKAELEQEIENGNLKNVFMQVRYVFYLARRNVNWLVDADN